MLSTTAEHADALRGLCEAIAKRRESALTQGGVVSPQHVPRASGIDKCARAMQFDILHWDKRPAFDPHLLARLERGKAIEARIVVPELMQLGFDVSGGQRSLEIKGRDGKTVCTGHIDGVLTFNGVRIVFDCKSVHPRLWEKIPDGPDGVRHMLDDPFMHRYPWQILLYMYAHEIEAGLFILDDCLGHWKFVWLTLMDNLARVEEAIRQCEAVVAANAEQRELPYYEDADHCRRCRWFSAGVCSPPMTFRGGSLLSDAELSAALAKRDELKPIADEFDALDKEIRGRFKELGDGDYIVGDFAVKVESKPWKSYQVAASVRQMVKITATKRERERS